MIKCSISSAARNIVGLCHVPSRQGRGGTRAAPAGHARQAEPATSGPGPPLRPARCPDSEQRSVGVFGALASARDAGGILDRWDAATPTPGGGGVIMRGGAGGVSGRLRRRPRAPPPLRRTRHLAGPCPTLYPLVSPSDGVCPPPPVSTEVVGDRRGCDGRGGEAGMCGCGGGGEAVKHVRAGESQACVGRRVRLS